MNFIKTISGEYIQINNISSAVAILNDISEIQINDITFVFKFEDPLNTELKWNEFQLQQIAHNFIPITYIPIDERITFEDEVFRYFNYNTPYEDGKREAISEIVSVIKEGNRSIHTYVLIKLQYLLYVNFPNFLENTTQNLVIYKILKAFDLIMKNKEKYFSFKNIKIQMNNNDIFTIETPTFIGEDKMFTYLKKEETTEIGRF